jgi:hypothetical protein
MTSNDEIIMGIQFSSYEEKDGLLYFSGAALEEGVWTDANGNIAFYPREVIRAAAKAFEGVDILCEHKLGTVGTILSTAETELGFMVTKGVLRHPASIEAVKSGEKRGLSIGALVRLDVVRRVATEIFSPKEISLVRNPACRTCMLDKDFKEGETSMSENIIENPEVDCEQYSDDAEKYDACQKFVAAIESFRKAQEEWNSLFEKGETEMSTKENIEVTEEPEVTEIAASSEVAEVEVEVEIEASTEEVVEETVEEVEAASEEIVEDVEVEASTEEVTEEVEEVEASTEEVEVEETEVEASTEEVVEEVAEEVEVEASAETVEEVEVEASSHDDAIAELKGLIDDANAKIEALQVEKAALSAEVSVLKAENETMINAEHDRLLGVAMSADPNADQEFLADMGIAQLGAYIETVERLKTPTVGAKRKSVKKESTVELSAPEVDMTLSETKKELTGRDATKAFIDFMSKSQ